VITTSFFRDLFAEFRKNPLLDPLWSRDIPSDFAIDAVSGTRNRAVFCALMAVPMTVPKQEEAAMADVNRPVRPLSPHLQIYRPQLTSMTSILTRITGNALIVSAVLVVWWLLAAATSDAYFAFADAIVTSWFGDLVLVLSLWAVWYHYLAGLRHLYFDAGKGLDIPTAEKLGWGMIIGSVVLTVLTIVII
jgi:succinate dehydrogenase / fumarate reductase cytochrome b subunit